MMDSPFSATEPLSLFPTMVWKLHVRDELQATIGAAVEGLCAGRPTLARGEGWQSVRDLHLRAELAPLLLCVRRGALGVLRFLHVGVDAIEVTGCWANVLAPGASHRMHSHPNNFLSGVYYLQAPAGADALYFHDPRPQTGVFRPPVTELMAENTDQVAIRVVPGTLLLFPSFLPHSVEANTSAEERVSISFNLMFQHFTEDLARPLW